MTKNLPTSLETVRLEPDSPANCAIIWLHGLGADGYDFVPIAEQLHLPKNAAARFIFPHAPVQAVTLNGGIEMRAWFDITELSLDTRADEAGLRHAGASIDQLIDEQIQQGIDPQRIILAGFSQGGALALHVGLRYPRSLGGLIALSTFLPLAEAVKQEKSDANRKTPIFMAHGTFDPILQYQWAELSRDNLQALGYTVSWHGYEMQHEVTHELILCLGLWLTERLTQKSTDS